MALRLTTIEQLANCSPAIRAQLEKHLAAGPAVAVMQAPREHGKRARPEQDAGRRLVAWVDELVLPDGCRPGQFFYHVPNGGGRSAIEAAIFKGQGVRAGWPDYGLDLPRGRYHGLRLELKAPEGDKPDKDQLDILARLESVGYRCNVAWGFEEACHAVQSYLGIGR